MNLNSENEDVKPFLHKMLGGLRSLRAQGDFATTLLRLRLHSND